ncbi:NAD-dependent dehydratase [Flexivirga endophytica]|uniref:NAD-dependent dehydratase n=1 Tax=Flexivirga endophytica TaxID=1849103 RepID=A0A916WRS6_9MICO|nr:NAD(P)-dependent oxidoreductase [Flexivirga endophytica]GGB23512.1 NAD-dependent dehydratase [Flexivirga endophytica]GHB57455.1 NAD-dependent dehydratase [Flexivirga endophytica]
MATEARTVILTGAAGRIGRAITPMLPTDWDLRRTDLRAEDVVTTLDVTDLDACRSAFAGADAVVHLAAVPDPEADWDSLLPANIIGAHHVAQAAAECEVRRLVLASSVQAVAARPAGRQSRATDAPRPMNLYGATKAWAEALGSWVAATTAVSVVALRLGYFYETQPGPGTPDYDLSAWLSPRDAADLIRNAVTAEGFDFFVANGISANRYPTIDLDDTLRTLGYRPVDDAWQSR